jgi:large subunit ribosomal protein L4
MDLPAHLFGVTPREPVLHRAVVSQLKNQRQGNAATRGRSEVSGGGIKPWRQKGTGRARAGTIRSPLWPGGGTVFGPHPKGYQDRMPKKQKRLAIRSAFSALAGEDRVRVIENLALPDHKTKRVAELMGRLELAGKKVLFLDEGVNRNLDLAARNIPGVKVLRGRLANVKDMLAADVVVISLPALKDIEEVFA